MTRAKNCKSLIGNSINWKYKNRMIEKYNILDKIVNA